jgi:hypothetical protein
MQADYFNYHQMALPPLPQQQQQAFATFGPFPYGYAASMPNSTAMPLLHHRNLERLKKIKPKHFVVDSNKYDEVINNSTDESIHLVKTRKTGGWLFLIYLKFYDGLCLRVGKGIIFLN